MPVKSRLLRCLSFGPFKNGAHGRTRTCTGDALDVVSLLLDYAGFKNENEMISEDETTPPRAVPLRPLSTGLRPAVLPLSTPPGEVEQHSCLC